MTSNLLRHKDEVLARIQRRRVVLFLDFDGTIAPIADAPDQVVVSRQVRSSLERIAAITPLAVVSGRALDDLRERVGISGIIYAGNHGAEIMIGEKVLRNNGTGEMIVSLQSFLDALRSGMRATHGVLIEDKGITASVHFRKVDPSREGEVLRIFWDVARDYAGEFRITTGKKVLEIRPRNAWNKGDAVKRIVEQQGGDVIALYVGDDTTDEDAYRAIRENGISVSIGENAEADYYLRSQDEVGPFLEWIEGVLSI